MPIYAYKCESCGHRQDVLQKLSDPLLTVCPSCSAPAFSKQVTAAGFQLKGSGWYVTDFRNPAAAAKPDAKGEGKADDKADAKADAKTEPKTDAKPAEGGGADKPAAAAAPKAAEAAAAPAPAAPSGSPAAGS